MSAPGMDSNSSYSTQNLIPENNDISPTKRNYEFSTMKSQRRVIGHPSMSEANFPVAGNGNMNGGGSVSGGMHPPNRYRRFQARGQNLLIIFNTYGQIEYVF